VFKGKTISESDIRKGGRPQGVEIKTGILKRGRTGVYKNQQYRGGKKTPRGGKGRLWWSKKSERQPVLGGTALQPGGGKKEGFSGNTKWSAQWGGVSQWGIMLEVCREGAWSHSKPRAGTWIWQRQQEKSLG